MHVVVDMVDAEAVITAASRTITEFKAWEPRVRFPADGAFVSVGMRGFLVPFPSCRFPEVYGLLCAGSPVRAQVMHQVVIAEDKEIQDGDNRKERVEIPAGDQICNNSIHKKHGVYEGKPFDFQGNDKKDHKSLIRKEGRKCEQQRQIHVVGDEKYSRTADEPDGKTVDYVKQHRQKVINREFWRAPLLFQRCADKIGKVKHQYQKENWSA